MVSDWGEVVTRYPYGNVRMDHLLSKEQTVLFSVLLVMFFIIKIGHWKLHSNNDEKPNLNNFTKFHLVELADRYILSIP